MRRLAVLALAGILSGCSLVYTEVGVPVPSRDGLEIGLTTKAEALDSLGPPRIVRRQFDGELYTWRRTKSRRRSLTLIPIYVRAFHYSDAESQRDDLSLLFDREGVLRGIGRRLETEEGS